MKEFKGTPGPWVAHDDEESMATSVIMDDFGDILCVVGAYMTSMEEDLANSNLIAAAPELLEALQFTIHDIGYWLSTQKPELKEKIESAINKAL